MILTRKQQAVIRLVRSGCKPAAIARETGLARETVSRLLSRAKKNLRAAGLDPDKVISGRQFDLLELVT